MLNYTTSHHLHLDYTNYNYNHKCNHYYNYMTLHYIALH